MRLCEIASVKEVRLVKDIFKTVYKASNINQFFINDLDKIKQFKGEVANLEYTGINKMLAKKDLGKYLDDIISRLEKNTNIYEIE